MNNILLKIAYDGSGFHGWQKQPGVRTAQGELEEKLGAVLRAPFSLEASSRTDAGVHALGQRATLRGDFGIPTDRISFAVNNLLTDAKVLCAEEKPEGFHARFDAVGKTYIYRFAVMPANEVFLRNYVCLLADGPNIDNMSEAAKYMEGTHDFVCFQAAGGAERESTERTLFSVSACRAKGTDPTGCIYDAVEIEVTGDGFLYNMVRIIAGTLLEAGRGKIAPGEVKSIIAAKDRSKAGPTAPPGGLYLKDVYYDIDTLTSRTKERQ